MQNSKLINLLSSFSNSEMKQFLLWLKSPVHNDSQILINLFEEIYKHYPKLSGEKVERKELFKKLYPKKEFQDELMRKNFSNLYNQSLDFIAWKDYNQQKYPKEKFLFNALFHKQQYKELMYELNVSENIVQKEKVSIESVMHQIEIAQFKSKVIFNISEKNGKQKNDEKHRMYLLSIQAKQDAYFIDFVSYFLIYLSYSKVYGFESKNDKAILLETLYEQTTKSNFIKIYHQLYLLQSDYSYHNLSIIFDLIERYYTTIAPLDMYNILNILINTINDHFKLDNAEDEIYRMKAFNILTVPSILFAKDPVLNSILYSNIIFTYINLKEFSKAMDFINNYTKYLDADLQSSYKALALARWYFAQNDYDNVQTCLMKTEKLEPHLRLRTRLMLVEVYYFKSEFDLLYSFIASTEKQLKRDKFLFPKNTRKSIFTFLTMMEKLGKISQFPAKKSIEKLKSKLLNSESFLMKDMVMVELEKLS